MHLVSDSHCGEPCAYSVSLVFTQQLSRFRVSGNIGWEGVLNDGTRVLRTETETSSHLYIGEDVLMTLRFDSRHVVCEVMERDTGHGKRRPQPGGYFIPLLVYLLSRENCYVIHGSAVSKDGKAVIFLGPSGSGKTSISLSLSRKGFVFMGDDLVIIQEGKDGAQACSLLFKPKVVQNDGTKSLLDISKESQINTCKSAPLHAMINLPYSPGIHQEIESRSERDVLDWLLYQGNPPRFYAEAHRWVNFAYRIASSTKGWTWGPGTLDQVDVSAIEEILK